MTWCVACSAGIVSCGLWAWEPSETYAPFLALPYPEALKPEFLKPKPPIRDRLINPEPLITPSQAPVFIHESQDAPKCGSWQAFLDKATRRRQEA